MKYHDNGKVPLCIREPKPSKRPLVLGMDLQGLGGHGAGLQGPEGQGVGLQGPRGSTGRFDGSSDDLEGIYAYI